ncbi:hypothetical protein B9Z47_08630 [Limnohabitans sp. 2KL-1]|nr:hypothetical protein B9Z47_08630 [Limnohabitans sp. 2KL-1]
MTRFESHTLSRSESIQNVLVFAFLSLSLVLPGAYVLLCLALTGMGLWPMGRWRNHWTALWQWPEVRRMVWGVGLFVVMGIFVGFWYGYKLSYYEAFVPFVLMPFMLSGVIGARLQAQVLWLGAATGAILAGALASYQSLVMHIGRAMGAMNHPIVFGDLAVVLACISLFGILFFEQARSSWLVRMYMVFGAVFGVWASLLSGSKGGWLSIVMVLIVFAWKLMAQKPVMWRLASVLVIGLLVAKGVWLAPDELVVQRVQQGFNGGLHWYKTGEVVDWSVSIRLELWSYAVHLFAERPWLGWGGGEALRKLGEHLKPLAVPEGIAPVFENDILHYAAVSGLVGLSSLVALFGGLFAGFWQLQRRKHARIQAYVLLGMLLVVLIFEFGLTVNALGRNAFRYFFSTLTVMLLGLAWMAGDDSKDRP